MSLVPRDNNIFTVLGKIHVVGKLNNVQVEMLLQQALADWQKNH